jgi:hypothetical protein
MVTITVILGMGLAFALGAYTGIKAVQMGLKYQMDIKDGIKPVLNPIRDAVERHEDKKEVKEYNNTTSEMIRDIWGASDAD